MLLTAFRFILKLFTPVPRPSLICPRCSGELHEGWRESHNAAYCESCNVTYTISLEVDPAGDKVFVRMGRSYWGPPHGNTSDHACHTSP
jgi:hypothetical protein